MPRRASLTTQETRDLEMLQEEVVQRRSRPRSPQRIGEVVSKWLSRRGYGQLRATAELRELWQSAVGTKVGRDSRPGTLRRGVLEVFVRNSTVLQELTFQKKQLLRQLSAHRHDAQFEDLRFRIGAMEIEENNRTTE